MCIRWAAILFYGRSVSYKTNDANLEPLLNWFLFLLYSTTIFFIVICSSVPLHIVCYSSLASTMLMHYCLHNIFV